MLHLSVFNHHTVNLGVMHINEIASFANAFIFGLKIILGMFTELNIMLDVH